MNKLNKIFLVIIIILVIALTTVTVLYLKQRDFIYEYFGNYDFSLNSEKSWITDNEFLYDKAIAYIEREENTYLESNNLENYKVFTDYEGFGITEKYNRKYVYMWIFMESYYTENGEVKIFQGSSMPYKFTFENNEVIGYEVPQDGTYYASSIKEMFPDSIEDEVWGFQIDTNKLKKKVNTYYNIETNEYLLNNMVNEQIIN